MGSDVFQIVTDQVLELLDKGVAPWRQPWRASTDKPRNLVSGKAYRGINVWLLMTKGHASPYWMTYKQAQQLGGNVQRGEKSTLVVFWKMLLVTETDKETGKNVTHRVPMLRHYNVFNLEQTDGCRIPSDAEQVAAAEVEPIEAAEQVVANMPLRPVVHEQGGRACYMPLRDVVQVPARSAFTGIAEFYSTLFHELGHATGHQSRLNRAGIMETPSFGSGDYGREELVAEFTAAFLCGETGISPAVIEHQAAYLASWKRTIKADKRALVVAAGAAQRAADFILDRSVEVTKEADEGAA